MGQSSHFRAKAKVKVREQKLSENVTHFSGRSELRGVVVYELFYFHSLKSLSKT